MGERERERKFVLSCTAVLSVYLSGEMIKATWDLHMCTPGRQEISHHHCPLPACLNVMKYTLQLQRERKREQGGTGGGGAVGGWGWEGE